MNPQNVCIFSGNVSQVKIVKYKNNNEINYIEIRLEVVRNYLNKGEQKCDFPIIRLSKIHKDFEKFMEIAKEGNAVSVVGQYTTEEFLWEGKKCFKTYFLAEDIVLNTNNTTNKELNKPKEEEYCELPY